MLMTHSSVQDMYRADFFCLQKGEKTKLDNKASAIIFVKKGEVIPFFDHFPQKPIAEGEMFFLPQGINCTLESFISYSEALVVHIPNVAILCHRFFPGILFKNGCIPGSFSHPLALKGFLMDWMDSLLSYIKDKRTDHLITEIKTLELFHFIKNTYAEDTITNFFASIDENDYKFVLFVLQNYEEVRTVEELATKSVYSLSGFEKQFRRIFKIAPYKWMLKQKSESIYKEIYNTSKPLKIIAEEFGFSGLSEMGNFCRRHLGASPSTMRARNYNK